MRAIVTSLIVTALFTSAGYGALFLADGRYVRQDTWIAESRAQERRHLNRRIDELEYQGGHRNLTSKERWELRRLQTEREELN